MTGASWRPPRQSESSETRRPLRGRIGPCTWRLAARRRRRHRHRCRRCHRSGCRRLRRRHQGRILQAGTRDSRDRRTRHLDGDSGWVSAGIVRTKKKKKKKKKGKTKEKGALQLLPHPTQPLVLVGLGGLPDVQEGLFELSTGSVVLGVVVGCGLGVTVRVAGGWVMPPMMVVLPPRVSVSTGGV